MLQYVAPALGGIVLLITVINIVKALIRGFKKSLGSLVAILLAAIISAIVTIFVCSPNSGLVAALEGMMLEMLPAEGMGEIFAIKSLGVAITYYISMLLAPFFFLACYSLLSIIFSIVIAIVIKFVPLFNNPSKLLHRLGGAGIGLLCGFLVSLLVLSPVIGTLGAVSGLISSEDDSELGEMDLTVFEYTGFMLTYDLLASADYEGERVYLRAEMGALTGMIGVLGSMGGDVGTMTTEQIGALRSFVSTLDGSPLMRNTIADVFATAAEKWTSGEEFLGITSFDAGELLSPVIHEMLIVFKTTNKDCIIADLTTMVDIFDVLIESDMVNDTDYQTMLKKLGDGVVADLLVATNHNHRMAPVADEITKLSVKALASTLGVPADSDERYDQLMSNIATTLNDTHGMESGERFVAVRGELDKEFDRYGVHIEGLALDHATAGIINDLGNEPEVSGSDVKEFFVVYNLGSAEADGEGELNRGGVAMLGAAKSGLVVNADGTVSVNGVVLRRYNASNLYTSNAYTMGANGVEIGGAATLTDAEHMESTMLTLDLLYAKLKHYSDCSDAEGESEKVGEIFTEMAKAFGDMDFDNAKFSDIMGNMGGVFDLMKKSEVFGNESAQLFLKMMLQSDAIYDSMGLTHSELNDFADKMNAYAENREGGYADATLAVAGTYDAIDKASDKNVSREEKTEASRNMIDKVNHENKEMISSMVTSNMVNDFGVDVNNTDNVSESFRNLIYNMASYKDKAPSDEELSSEANAVSKILALATVGAGEGPKFDRDGVEGSIDSSSDAFIKTMVESEVVMETVGQTVDGKEQGSNPYGITYDTEEEKQDVANSLEKYYVENAESGDPELEDKLYDLAIVMDVEIDLDQYK